MDAMNRGYYITAIISAVFLFFGVRGSSEWQRLMYFFYAGLVGIALSVCFLLVTHYYTDHHYPPVKKIADASETGAATNIITGFSVVSKPPQFPAILIGLHPCCSPTGAAP